MRLIASVLIALALTFAAGCGDDDEPTITTSPVGTTGASGATGATGSVGETVTIDDVQGCLEGAGFEANDSDSELIGVESSYEKLDVPLEDLDQGASIVVFEDAATAESEADAADIAMGVAETTVAGNVIYGTDSSVSEPEDAEAAIEGCVPAS